MSNASSKYDARGVSAGKEEVHAAIKKLDHGLYPNSFSKIYPDYLAGDPDYCNIMSSDGSGTKSIIAYLYWQETGDASVWRGIAQDTIVMNLDDLLCVGASGPFIFSSVINRNKHLITGEAIREIIEGTQSFFDGLQPFGIDVKFLGGETADLGDSVRTVTVDGTMVTRMRRDKLITNEKIQAGDVIVGIASYGQATYEQEYNSGIGSNGLTSARHDVLAKYLEDKYPEAYDPAVDSSVRFTGSKRIDEIEAQTSLPVGKLLLSPTRTFAPILKQVLQEQFEHIHGIVHCTGGGQTKVLHFIEGLRIVKDNLLAPPPVFELIQSESQTDWKEMYKVFNMGQRMELFVPEAAADSIISIAQSFGLDAQRTGYVESAETKEVLIKSPYGEFTYH